MKKNIIYIAIAVILAGIIVTFFALKYLNKPPSTFEDAKAVYSISAQNFYDEYQIDKNTASQKYTGKVIEISGKYYTIEVVDQFIKIVFVFSQGMFGDQGIRCTMLPKYNEKAKSLPENSKITLKGYCSGYNDTDIILEKCIIVE
ncbi:hypothetical protein ACFL6I_18940 [candidate division KSB1 bacterium]